MTPKLVVLQSRKKLQVIEKKLFEKKKSFQFICTDKTYKTVCGIFKKIDRSRDI